MFVSYILVSIAVVMFAFMFFFNSEYEKNSGSSVRAILTFSLGTYAVGFVILFIINRLRFEPTAFSLAVSAAAAVNIMLYSFCSIKSFGKINLSLFSVFAMLGGMALPFAVGILFFHEGITLGKTVCFITIALALAFTVDKNRSKGGFIYYAGVFVFNGMSGVIAKFYQSSDYPKASEAGYSVQIAAWVIVLCSVLLLFSRGEKIKFNLKSLGCVAGCGFLGNVGNYLLLLGLANLPASAQYPFVTGGTMIVSTVICFFTPDKPKKRELIAVALSFAGIVALCIL